MVKWKDSLHFNIFIDKFWRISLIKILKTLFLLDHINLVELLGKVTLSPPIKSAWVCSGHIFHLLSLTYFIIEVSKQKICIFLIKRKHCCWHTDDDVFKFTVIDGLNTISSAQWCQIKSGMWCLHVLLYFYYFCRSISNLKIKKSYVKLAICKKSWKIQQTSSYFQR